MNLSPTPMRVLDVLKQHAGQAMKPDDIALLARCSRKSVRVHLHYIRPELPLNCAIICEGWGKGYRYVERAA